MTADQDRALLARVDERTKLTALDIADIKLAINKMEANMSGNYVSKAEFAPIRSVVTGFVGVVLLAFIGLIISVTIGAPK